jgi:hypothetical protein
VSICFLHGLWLKTYSAAAASPPGTRAERRIGFDKLDVLEDGRRRAFAALGQHLGSDVGGHDVALGSGHSRRRERGLALARSHIEHPAPGSTPARFTMRLLT